MDNKGRRKNNGGRKINVNCVSGNQNSEYKGKERRVVKDRRTKHREKPIGKFDSIGL